MISILGISVAVGSGIVGLIAGHPIGKAWRAWKRVRRLFPNIDRSKLSPEERAQLESIEAKYATPAGNAGAEIGR